MMKTIATFLILAGSAFAQWSNQGAGTVLKGAAFKPGLFGHSGYLPFGSALLRWCGGFVRLRRK